MSKIEEIEQAVAQLPLTDFVKLAVWVDRAPPAACNLSVGH